MADIIDWNRIESVGIFGDSLGVPEPGVVEGLCDVNLTDGGWIALVRFKARPRTGDVEVILPPETGIAFDDAALATVESMIATNIAKNYGEYAERALRLSRRPDTIMKGGKN